MRISPDRNTVVLEMFAAFHNNILMKRRASRRIVAHNIKGRFTGGASRTIIL